MLANLARFQAQHDSPDIADRRPRVEKSDRYGNETSAVGNRIVPAAAVTSSTCRSAGRGESHGRKGGGKMSLRHQSLPVNRTSPVRLRGRSYQPARDWPVELDARRLARPVRRRLVGVILHSRCTLPLSGRSIARRVIPTFYPIRLGRPVSAADWGRCGQTFDVQHRRPSCFKAGEAQRNERNPVHGGSRFFPKNLVQPGWRGELRAW